MSTIETSSLEQIKIKAVNDAAAALQALAEAAARGESIKQPLEIFIQQFNQLKSVLHTESGKEVYDADIYKIILKQGGLRDLVKKAGRDLQIALAKPIVAGIKAMEQQFSENLPYQNSTLPYTKEELEEIKRLVEDSKLPKWSELVSDFDQYTQNSLIILMHICTALGERSDTTDLMKIYLSVDKDFNIPVIASHVEKLGDDLIIEDQVSFIPLQTALMLVREEQSNSHKALSQGTTKADERKEKINDSVCSRLINLIKAYNASTVVSEKDQIKEEIRHFLESDVDISQGAMTGNPALAQAAEADPSLLKMFFEIRKINSPGLKNEDLRDALHNAIREKKQENIEFLVTQNPALLVLTNRALNTALHAAVVSRNMQAIIYLISKGADISLKNRQQYSPLALAFGESLFKEDPGAMVVLNAVLDGFEDRFDVENNKSAKRYIEALRKEINEGVVNQENVDAKFYALMMNLTTKPVKNKPLRDFFSIRNRTASAPAAISPPKEDPLKRGSQSESDLTRVNRGVIENPKETQSARDSNAPATISPPKEGALKIGSQSESDLARFSRDLVEDTKETQDAKDSKKIRRSVSLSDLMSSRKMAKTSAEKTPEEIRLELIKLIDERLKSLGAITAKSSSVKVGKVNELKRLHAILEGADTYPVVFIITEDNKKKIDCGHYKVSNDEDYSAPPSQMKKDGDVIGRLNLASKLLNRAENREILEQHRNKRVHKTMTKIRETFIHAIENLLRTKVEESWRESLSKTALFIETFNRLWPGSTVKPQPSAETKAIARTSRAVDSHGLVTASGNLGVFRAAAKKVEEANPVLSKLVQSVQGIKPSRSTR